MANVLFTHFEDKMQGNIVCFRNLKKRTDEAVRLFSDKEAKQIDNAIQRIKGKIKKILEERNK